jgi:hypothetical protein
MSLFIITISPMTTRPRQRASYRRGAANAPGRVVNWRDTRRAWGASAHSFNQDIIYLYSILQFVAVHTSEQQHKTFNEWFKASAASNLNQTSGR